MRTQKTINQVLRSISNEETKEKFLNLIDNHPESHFDRNNMDGHITGSMLVFNESGDKVLLTHHKKLGKWLQLGGHNDSESGTILETAVKEMEEEGFDDRRVNYTLLTEAPIDLDVHWVGNHNHYDVCFACKVSNLEEISCSHESESVEWKPISEILSNKNYDERLSRMIKTVLDFKLLQEKSLGLKY